MHLSSVWAAFFFFSSSLGSQESHSSRWTSGLWKSHINLAEMMRQPRTRAVCSNAHHSTWPQPIAGHLAPHSGSRISLGPRIFSCLLGFLCLPSDICPFRFLRHPEIPSLLGLWVSQLRERLALSANEAEYIVSLESESPGFKAQYPHLLAMKIWTRHLF